MTYRHSNTRKAHILKEHGTDIAEVAHPLLSLCEVGLKAEKGVNYTTAGPLSFDSCELEQMRGTLETEGYIIKVEVRREEDAEESRPLVETNDSVLQQRPASKDKQPAEKKSIKRRRGVSGMEGDTSTAKKKDKSETERT